MAKPLRSDDPAPQNMQFSHFGVLNDGNQSKSSLFTSIALNVVLALCAIIIGAAAKKTIDTRHKLTELTEPIPMKKPDEPPPIKIKPPKIPPIPVVKVDPPKIKLPDVKLPDVPKPPELKMAQPMPVALGSTTNPIAVSNKPSTTAINLGNKGMAGMPASNNGAGAPSTVVNLGSGSPNSQNMKGNGPVAVAGIPHGVVGGTGPLNSPTRVALGQNTPPPMPKPVGPTSVTGKSGPKVLFKPKPEYTAEAKQLHIEGNVTVKIRV